MKARLLRALQRGGVTAPIKTNLWAVWRTPDRRRRIAGTLLGGEVDLHRVYGDLVPHTANAGPVLHWCADADYEERSFSGNNITDVPLLDHLILTWHSEVGRGDIASAAIWLRRYLACGDSVGSDRTRLDHCLNAEDWRFLRKLIMSGANKSGMATQFGLRRAEAERNAIRLLELVAHVRG